MYTVDFGGTVEKGVESKKIALTHGALGSTTNTGGSIRALILEKAEIGMRNRKG
jgi:hypothetical protein